MRRPSPDVPWLLDDEPFPPLTQAWDANTPAPGLLAAGASLAPERLIEAYRRGIFPWFSPGQPILWWSPDPRMLLRTENFKLHPSLRKTLRQFMRTPGCELRIDHDFALVMRHCASTPRAGQGGTWIVPAMIEAYQMLHQQGLAHSIETWRDGELVGGLYCVAIGGMVYGESMFTLRRDASKIALSALVALCLSQGLDAIDCQQNTAHLASLGAAEIARAEFVALVSERIARPSARWQFDPVYWSAIL